MPRSDTVKRITERERASEGRYRTLFEYAGDGILIADSDGRYLDANASICRMLGYSRDELIGMHSSGVVVPGETQHIAPTLSAITPQTDHHREWEFRRKDGSTFAAEVIATRMPDGNVLGMIRDVTERRAIADQLREQASLLDKARDAIHVRGIDNRITFWNKSAERLYGWTAEEAIGAQLPELLHEDRIAFAEASRHLMLSGEWLGDIRVRSRHGEELTVEARWTLVRDAAGLPHSILAINTDVTGRNTLEQQFLRAQRMESIGTLAGGIAHDLNNVLSPITMAVDLLRATVTDGRDRQLLDTMAESVQRGAEMVRQVLSFARGMDGRRMEVHPRALIEDLARIVRDTFPKDIQLRTTLSPDLRTLQGDPTQLHQVLLNLCLNARDAMPEGGRITIAAENTDLHAQDVVQNTEGRIGPYVTIRIEDTGTGIRQEFIDKMFDPFFTTKEVGKGTGLGLSTSLGIVKGHGGFIRVSSEVGKGTRFVVFLPVEAGAPQILADAEPVEQPRGHGETVLVVDDEASIRQIARQTLEAFGYRVLLAANGAEAVALHARQGASVDAILMDMMMPVMDGAAAIQAIRKQNPSARIVAASGVAANDSVATAAGLGVTHFLPKPYTADDMLKALRNVIAAPVH